MKWAPQSTQKTIYDLLTGDAQLQTLIGATLTDKKVYDFVPDNQPFPFITIGQGQWQNRGNEDFQGVEVDMEIHVWYRSPNRGRLKVQEIQKRIDELLHRQDPCIEDWNIIALNRKFVDILIEDDNVTLHGVQIFNLKIGES